MTRVEGSPGGCVQTLAVFLVIMAPVYYLLRLLVKLARQSYGFDVAEEDQEGLRVCSACHNTVLEPELVDCPYCGNALEPIDSLDPKGELHDR